MDSPYVLVRLDKDIAIGPRPSLHWAKDTL